MNILFVISNAFAYGTMDPSAYLINNPEFDSIYISPVAKDQNYNIQMQGMGGQPQVYWGTDPNHMNAMPVISGSPSGGMPGGMGMNTNFMANPNTGAMMSGPGPAEPLQPIFEASPSQSAAVAQGEMMTPGTTGQSQGAVTGMGVPPQSGTTATSTSSNDKKGSSSDKSSSSSSNKNSKNSKSSSSSKDKKNGTASVSFIVGLFGVILCTLLA